ncbi:DUF4365 domain-containing protein [Amycolatopsis samaneae]|uniref:DUF4365 domain-containing protein n=1 Tax=Amycolatopsis samaneae TaxID=664691 RepID=A0ABW5GI65_9PSEU
MASAQLTASLQPPNAASILRPNGQKARYGVSYLRNVCAQAGVGLNETSPDEDVLATDCDVRFPEGTVGVQVKCTSRLTLGGKTKTWRLKEEWIRKWEQCLLPVYFVLVVVPARHPSWLEHLAEGTMHHTAAFWQRIDTDRLGRSLVIPKAQRLTAETFSIWHRDLLAVFRPGGSQ